LSEDIRYEDVEYVLSATNIIEVVSWTPVGVITKSEKN